jgi:hypothetical protein
VQLCLPDVGDSPCKCARSVQGLSSELGAFVAGVMLSSTDQQEHCLSQLTSIRHFFMSLFISTTGLVMSPRFLLQHLPVLAGGVLVCIICKTCLVNFSPRLVHKLSVCNTQLVSCLLIFFSAACVTSVTALPHARSHGHIVPTLHHGLDLLYGCLSEHHCACATATCSCTGIAV